jgi:dTDP-4-amino-4,6-dideoxygalactose transaminase
LPRAHGSGTVTRASWAARLGSRLPIVPPDRDQAYQMFHVVLPSSALRDGVIVRLRERGILGVFHYVPLHLSAMGRAQGAVQASAPSRRR